MLLFDRIHVFYSIFLLVGHFTVCVVCGPYATCADTLSYTPLEDLMNTVEAESPDVLIMVRAILVNL